jgi:hypothetical protein
MESMTAAATTATTNRAGAVDPLLRLIKARRALRCACSSDFIAKRRKILGSGSWATAYEACDAKKIACPFVVRVEDLSQSQEGQPNVRRWLDIATFMGEQGIGPRVHDASASVWALKNRNSSSTMAVPTAILFIGTAVQGSVVVVAVVPVLQKATILLMGMDPWEKLKCTTTTHATCLLRWKNCLG